MKNSSAFFQNTECEYFPCHSGVDKEHFNCLFCFCPLYSKGDCNGVFYYLDNGLKDCSACVFPHIADNYQAVCKKLKEDNNDNEKI